MFPLTLDLLLLCSLFSASCSLPWQAQLGSSPTTCSLSSESTTPGCGFHTLCSRARSASNGKQEVSVPVLWEMMIWGTPFLWPVWQLREHAPCHSVACFEGHGVHYMFARNKNKESLCVSESRCHKIQSSQVEWERKSVKLNVYSVKVATAYWFHRKIYFCCSFWGEHHFTLAQ